MEQSNSQHQKDSGKTTCTFRISPENKLHMAATAKGLGMSTSQYIEALVLKRHGETINTLVEQKAANCFKFSKPLLLRVKDSLSKLKELHPDFSDEELMTACLDHAYSNHESNWQRTLSTYLNRLQTFLSNYKIRSI